MGPQWIMLPSIYTLCIPLPVNLGGPCDLLLTNRMWRSDATWPSRLSKIETFQLFLGFLGFLTQVEASCHVRNPTVLRAWCCEKAQATHMERLGGDREREGQPAPRNPSHPCRGAQLVSEEISDDWPSHVFIWLQPQLPSDYNCLRGPKWEHSLSPIVPQNWEK